jgi:hypothetical protein
MSRSVFGSGTSAKGQMIVSMSPKGTKRVFEMISWHISTYCLLFRYTSWHFYAFSRTNLLTSCHSASSLFSAIFVFQK